jgi:dolichyl-phosphate-mannose--protein O-mannosyl transferase
VRRPWIGTAIRDIVPSLYALVVVPLIVYLGTYGAWFASETGVDRHAAGNQIGTGGPFSFVPEALRSLWYYSAKVLEFHSGLTNSAGNHHPWESKPWTWPMGLRPMLYYFAEGEHVSGCGGPSCVKAVMLIGTPAMWWLAVPVLGWALWRTFVSRDWRYATVLTGYAAALLPWFVTLDRQMYYFYAVALAPFFVMAIALILGEILGAARASAERRGTGLLAVCLYVGPVVANFVWLWPILTAVPITPEMWQQQLWLPSWR